MASGQTRRIHSSSGSFKANSTMRLIPAAGPAASTGMRPPGPSPTKLSGVNATRTTGTTSAEVGVCRAKVLSGEDLLGRHGARRADDGVGAGQAALLAEPLRQPEVGDVRLGFSVEEDIGGLQVAGCDHR